jgi:hypothetical protein
VNECVGTSRVPTWADGWAVRGPWKRRTDAFSLGGEFTWKKDLWKKDLDINGSALNDLL